MKKTLMIAHRGFSKMERENTLIAFSVAGATEEFYGIETDIHVTNDNHFIIIHDENTSRVTNNRVNLDVEKNSYDIVKNVVLSDLDGNMRNDLRIPDMIDYFKICKKYNKVAVCELKQVFSKDQIAEIIKIVDSIDMLNNTIFISFILEDLIMLKEINENIQAQWLLCEYKEEHMETLLKYHLDVDAHYASINKEKIDNLHAHNIKVNIWTVDDINIANKYASWGVDFITSNALKSFEINENN
ncbi:MAG: hypothetical protein MR270_07015 [Erysipelotrichaceae bacterium]|nr:hypothetical protein [Erysipelotrichaceae bacterium]